jgi:predicted small secreted protein
MKRAAMTLAVSLAVSIVVVACASMQPAGRDLVAKAVSAQGGPEALATVKTLSYKATIRQWEPEQSAKAGGEMRLAGDATAVVVMDVATGTTRTDWVKNSQTPPRAPSPSPRSWLPRPATWPASTATAATSRAATRTRRPIRCRASGSPPPSASPRVPGGGGEEGGHRPGEARGRARRRRGLRAAGRAGGASSRPTPLTLPSPRWGEGSRPPSPPSRGRGQGEGVRRPRTRPPTPRASRDARDGC